ncbi:peptidoglycan-binding protein [Roseibium sp. RKSG952]|uniref:glycoside hydrolase family protein n=1 Tax=Roseibium sp. RKSG952 TaxID=2529384 RepID=UPI0012BC3396|nr:peptidoglycan-binding protein [Roseibium sp. RKSG952]MTH94775.1 peptidoglycan-binding protein [Roseibium sp. RKSG952]
MQTSERGLAFIAGHEGFVSRAYKDPVGVITIGTGFTNRSGVFRRIWGKPLKLGDRITRKENDRILKVLLNEEYEPPVLHNLPESGAKQHEFDACVSAVFNLGARFMSWKAMKLWRAGDKDGAAEHWERNYNTASGRTLRGLVRRRQEEAHLFLTGQYPGQAGEGIPRKVETSTPAKSDPVVEEAQIILSERGFDPGVIDGWMGQKTKAAVLAYQKAHPHLENDGILGPATLAQLRRDAKAVKDTATKGLGTVGGAGVSAFLAGLPWGLIAGGVAVAVLAFFAWRYRDVIQRRVNTLLGREVV